MLPYIVMEYVEGRTLRDILREGRRILPERALEITGSVLDALDYSHRAGIIHRDIKPANVMLTPAGDVKVMDFGIARAIADSSATMTQTAAVVGTAQYLSPEQARGEQVDARSDLYSAGCLLFELLTGRPPFVGDSPVSVAYQHVREEAQAPSTIDRDVSPAIDAITLKALTKRVDDRYQSASEMRADIDRALDGRPVLAPTVYGSAGQETEAFLPPPPRDPVPTAVGGVPAPHREDEPPKRTWLWVTLVVLLVAAVVAAAFLVPKLLSDNPPPTVAVPRIVGLTPDRATQAVEQVGLTLNECDTVNGDQRNKIVRQDPAEGERADEGSAVDCTLMVGPKTHRITDVVGQKFADAQQVLEDQGYKVTGEVDRTSTEKKNIVIAMDPPANTSLEEGQTVKLTYSGGWIFVDSYVGKTQEEAERGLSDLGFLVRISQGVSDQPAGEVIDQDPVDKRAPYGETVIITVSLGPTTPTEPTQPTEPTGPTAPTTSTIPTP
jgi:serine/threonine-protein kinase